MSNVSNWLYKKDERWININSFPIVKKVTLSKGDYQELAAAYKDFIKVIFCKEEPAQI